MKQWLEMTPTEQIEFEEESKRRQRTDDRVLAVLLWAGYIIGGALLLFLCIVFYEPMPLADAILIAAFVLAGAIERRSR